MRSLYRSTSAWIAVLLLRCLFSHEVAAALWVLDLFLVWGLGLWGAGLAIFLLVKGFRMSQGWRHRVVAGACLGLSAGLVFTPYPDRLGTYFKFYRNLETYQVMVEQIVEGSLAEDASLPSYHIDEGPPVRVAFPWGGIIDNWVGIVYDPSGEVERANAFKKDWSNWGDPELKHVKRLFGGDLRGARQLKKHWYYCSFT